VIGCSPVVERRNPVTFGGLVLAIICFPPFAAPTTRSSDLPNTLWRFAPIQNVGPCVNTAAHDPIVVFYLPALHAVMYETLENHWGHNDLTQAAGAVMVPLFPVFGFDHVVVAPLVPYG
jgi:hypothetical protein